MKDASMEEGVGRKSFPTTVQDWHLKKEMAKEGDLGGKSLRQQHSSEKVLARLMKSLSKVCLLEESHITGVAGTGVPGRLNHWLEAWGQHCLDVNTIEGPNM